MQKYKIIASKSQKKYTIVLSAESESEVKSKLHQEGYSILSVGVMDAGEIKGNKFIFHAHINGEQKNGIIVGDEIFKVYLKLRKDLGYEITSLYPQSDAETIDAEKIQKIMHQLEYGYEIHKKNNTKKEGKGKNGEQEFYVKKQLDETHKLIESAIKKAEYIFTKKEEFGVDSETLHKLQLIYEKLIHLKGSTNLAKLKEISEIALSKIGELELRFLEEKKDENTRNLLKETNTLLKKLGSDKHYIEQDKDIKKQLTLLFQDSVDKFKKSGKKKSKIKKSKEAGISYDDIKTEMILKKYEEKLKDNSTSIQKNIILFLNFFSQSEEKDDLLIKRKVIKQNITLLKVKRRGGISSYTTIKKGWGKFISNFFSSFQSLSKLVFGCICAYSLLFIVGVVMQSFDLGLLVMNPRALTGFLYFFIVFFALFLSRNFALLSINIVVLSFLFIFSVVNF